MLDLLPAAVATAAVVDAVAAAAMKYKETFHQIHSCVGLK